MKDELYTKLLKGKGLLESLNCLIVISSRPPHRADSLQDARRGLRLGNVQVAMQRVQLPW